MSLGVRSISEDETFVWTACKFLHIYKLCMWNCSLKSHKILLNTYSIKTYVLLHFKHKNDTTTIAKLSYRATSYRQVALWSLIMVVTSFLCLKCDGAGGAGRNTSQVVKVEMHLFQHQLTFLSWYDVTSNATWKLCRLTKTVALLGVSTFRTTSFE